MSKISISMLAVLCLPVVAAVSAEDPIDNPASIAYFRLRRFTGYEFDQTADNLIWKASFLRKTVSPEDIKMLEGFPELSHLELGGSDAGDEILKALAQAHLPELTNLDLEGCRITDAGMIHLGQLKQVEHLGLAGTLITDEGLSHLKDWKQLQTLDLSKRADTSFSIQFTDSGVRRITNFPDREKVQTHITDAGLKHLSGLTQLIALYLDGDDITDEGLRQLAELKQLESLDLSRTQITDAGLVYLKNMRKMDHLRLDETHVTDRGLSHLTHMTAMDWISLDGTRITNDGLKYLKDYQKMTTLTLSRTKVTNEGLRHLAPLKNMKMIFASETKIDQSGAEPLRQNSGRVSVIKE